MVHKCPFAIPEMDGMVVYSLLFRILYAPWSSYALGIRDRILQNQRQLRAIWKNNVVHLNCQFGRVANKPPSHPFQVWQMDTYGPLPVTQNRNSYVFTARDMFSKYLFTMAMPNMDSITVSQVLFQLTCHIGIGVQLLFYGCVSITLGNGE
jgi:hypothetical protein